MTISYLSSATAWSNIEKQWQLGLENTHHIVQYNIQGGDMLTTLLMNEGQLCMNQVRWGFAQNTDGDVSLLNARGEKIFSQSSFRFAIRNQRCVIPIDSFYITKDHPVDGPSSYRIKSQNDEALMIAGVLSEDGQSCAILTKPSEETLMDITARQPIFINDNDELLTWLVTKNMRDVDLQIQRSHLPDPVFHAITNELKSHINSPILHQAKHKNLTLFD